MSVFSIGAQIFLVEVGGDFVKTVHINAIQWLICVALGFIGAIIGVLMRFIPVKEDPADFFDNSAISSSEEEKRSKSKYSKIVAVDVEV